MPIPAIRVRKRWKVKNMPTSPENRQRHPCNSSSKSCSNYYIKGIFLDDYEHRIIFMRQKLEREAFQREESLPYVLRSRKGNCLAVEGCGCWLSGCKLGTWVVITAVPILGYALPYALVPQWQVGEVGPQELLPPRVCLRSTPMTRPAEPAVLLGANLWTPPFFHPGCFFPLCVGKVAALWLRGRRSSTGCVNILSGCPGTASLDVGSEHWHVFCLQLALRTGHHMQRTVGKSSVLKYWVSRWKLKQEIKQQEFAAFGCLRAAVDQRLQPPVSGKQTLPWVGATSIQTKLPLNDFIESWFTSWRETPFIYL